MEENYPKILKAYVFSCPGCGSPMRYDINARCMVCDSCGTHSIVTDFEDPSEGIDIKEFDTVEFVCPSCGASIHSADGAATSFCSYCGSDVVLNARMTRMRRPDTIVPFRITRDKCMEIYLTHLSSFRFAPKELSEQKITDHFRPIYIPFWRYNFTAKGKGEGTGSRTYTEGDYRYEDSYSYDVDSEITVSSLLYDASSAFEDETAQKLRFNFSNMPPAKFHPAYLCGLYAETPDVSDAIYKTALEAIAQEQLDKSLSDRTGTTGSCPLPENRETTAELTLMPVWLLTSRRGDRVLYTAINGYDGTIVCEPPINGRSFSLVTVALFCVIFALLLLATHFIVLRPNMVLALCGILSAVGMKHIMPRMDDILIRRQHDIDPTRHMKNTSLGTDKPLTKEEAGLNILNTQKSDTIKWINILICAFLLLVLFAFLVSFSASEAAGILISDRGIVPPIVLLNVFIMLLRMRYNYPKSPVDDDRKKASKIPEGILIVMKVLTAAGIIVMVFPIPGVRIWCYTFSITMLILLIVNLVMLNRINNEFVTRPVPILGKEAK